LGVAGAVTWLNLMTIGSAARAGAASIASASVVATPTARVNRRLCVLHVRVVFIAVPRGFETSGAGTATGDKAVASRCAWADGKFGSAYA
jgi:hypothetical protein